MCCLDCELIPVQITSLVCGWLSKGWSSIGHPFTVYGQVAAGWLLPHVPARTEPCYFFIPLPCRAASLPTHTMPEGPFCSLRAVAIQEVRRTSRNLICALLITIVTTHLWSHKVLTSSVSVPQTIQFRWQDWPVCDEARHYDDTLLLSGWQSNTLLWPVHRPRPLTLGKLWYGQQAFHKSSPHYLIFLSKNVAPSHHFLAGSAHTPVAVGDARILCTSTHNSLTLNLLAPELFF